MINKKILDTDSNPNLPGDFGDSELDQWLSLSIDYDDLSERGRKEVDKWKRENK